MQNVQGVQFVQTYVTATYLYANKKLTQQNL